ncbi:MAG: ArsA-related P-loop ATPase [Candidatus Binatia bacterium]
MKSIAEVVARHHVVICAGSGGVGKTTTAAALAVHGAEQGRRTMVMTIDPARRLADALGLPMVGNVAHPVDVGTGMLEAMLLDQKGAWDALVERYAPSAEVRQRILDNRFYQHLSQSFAGSSEYMAIEQLAQLDAGGRYDLIIVDTPPARHALDFLDAPRRIGAFLDRQVIRWFVKPYVSAGWSTLRAVNRVAGTLLRRLEDAVGITALVEVSDFFNAMSGLFEGLEARIASVEALDKLLHSKQTAFIVVTSPEEQVLGEAEEFCRQLAALDVSLRGVVFNRVQREALAGAGRLDEAWRCASWSAASSSAAATPTAWSTTSSTTRCRRAARCAWKPSAVSSPSAPSSPPCPTSTRTCRHLAGLRRMIPHLVAAWRQVEGAALSAPVQSSVRPQCNRRRRSGALQVSHHRAARQSSRTGEGSRQVVTLSGCWLLGEKKSGP